MTFPQFIINYWQYILSGLISACFLVVNIIQAIRTHDKSKLKEAICRIPEIINIVEDMFGVRPVEEIDGALLPLLKGVHADIWSVDKKLAAKEILRNEFGKKFVNKHIKELDDAIEDILSTPQKKGGSCDGISKENEER